MMKMTFPAYIIASFYGTIPWLERVHQTELFGAGLCELKIDQEWWGENAVLFLEKWEKKLIIWKHNWKSENIKNNPIIEQKN